ncbi:hypothetical protein IF1G_03282 [Cordyceps javanica]|uniref:Uncharacterized protein n=1 Tax=Cordyceps javanica TaxID=43265 RepID=A0A545V747_9HYPO|nr:hypothetical protein IF1G_03282 [Cordyceps javanica]TQW09274.1 hypothetical protein IF2G_03705 [Cordyceps javanica]
MQSLFSVTNNVSLITVNVTPGTFLAIVGLLLCFLTLYIPFVPHIRLPRVSFPRNLVLPPSSPSHGGESPSTALIRSTATASSYSSSAAAAAAAADHRRHKLQKVLPALPAPLRSRGALPAPPSLIEQLTPSRQLALPDMAQTQSPPPPLRSQVAAGALSPKTGGTAEEEEHHLDASLQDFEPPASPASPMTEATSPTSTRQSSVLASSEPATEEGDHRPAASSNLGADSEADSAAGGFSPPAWRRLGNGDRSSGFWRHQRDDDDDDDDDDDTLAVLARRRLSPRGLSPFSDDSDDGDEGSLSGGSSILQRAIQTRLPAGSQSPEKLRTPSPQVQADKIKVEPAHSELVIAPTSRAAPSDNCKSFSCFAPVKHIRFAVRAEVQQRTEPIDAAISFVRKRYKAATSSWAIICLNAVVALVSILFVKTILQPVAPRPAGDLVKVAGVARSFEPLIYYSENAVAQVHDLQATSVAVWDLSESVRSSDMRDAKSIVSDLDSLSETMRTLSVEMTKFFARVDGDVDGILNVMDWARMHLNRLHSAPAPSTISAAYDNIHNLLSHARVLEDADGAPTSLGNLATSIFGLSNPQREQRLIQLLFTEFLTVLEDSIAAELQHSVTLFALFEAVDNHFLNLARSVVRESSAQEALHADALASLWVRLLGARAAELHKFAQNRDLLRDIRDKTVRNKRILVDHHGRLLTLKASLEQLRGKLVSPLVRGANATTTLLSLEDQIQGIGSVSDYLAGLRRHQKGKVMEHLFSSVPGQRIPPADETRRVGGFDAHGEKV